MPTYSEEEKGQEVMPVPISPSARSAALEIGKGAHMIAEGVHLAHSGGLPIAELAREISGIVAKEKLVDSLTDVGEKTKNEQAQVFARELKSQDFSTSDLEVAEEPLDKEEQERLAALRAISDHLDKAREHHDDKEAARRYIQEARVKLGALDKIDQQSFRHSVISAYDACGLHEEAQSFVDQKRDEDPPLDWILETFDRGADALHRGDTQRARAIAETVRTKEHEKFSELMRGIAEKLAQEGEYEQAEQTINQIVVEEENDAPDREWQGSGYVKMVGAAARRGDSARAKEWIDGMQRDELPHIFEAQKAYWAESVRGDSDSLERVMTQINEAQQNGTISQGQHGSAMRELAIALLETGHFELAKVAAGKVSEVYWRNDAFTRIATAQSGVGLIDEARSTAERISKLAQVRVLQDVAKDEIRHGVHRYLDAKAKLSALPPEDLAGLKSSPDPQLQAVQRLLPF